MNNVIKRVIFGSYVIIATITILMRELSYIEYYFNMYLIVTTIALALHFYSENQKSYYIPLVISIISGIGLLILGLTQAADQLMGGLAVFLGIGSILIGVINFPLKSVYDKLLYPPRKKDATNNELFIAFFIFFLYMLTFSKTLLTAFNDVGTGALLIIVFIALLNILYFIVNWAFRKYSKEHRFNIVYSVLLGIIGINIYIHFFSTHFDTLRANVSIAYLSLILYICIIMIKEVFRIINK